MRSYPLNYKIKHSLARRIIIWFSLLTITVSVLFGMISVLMMYDLEDAFLDQGLSQQAERIKSEFEQTGAWPTTLPVNHTLHVDRADFPEEIRATALLEPHRTEFFGEGERYFHVKAFELDKPVYLVAEVSNQLILRLAREGIIEFLVICSLLVCVIVCLVAWVLSRKLTLPLNRLVAIVSEERPGELPVGFSRGNISDSENENFVFPSNEIGLLAHTLDASFERINQAIAREKAFTRDVSHELRTPLAIIKNAVELQLRRLESGNQTANSEEKTNQIKSDIAKQMSILNRIGNAAIEMEKTVQTLLLLAREEHAQSVKTQTDIMPIIEHVVIQHRHLLDDKEIEVVIDDSCNTQQMVNKDILTVLLNNLFLNAIQHTECGQIRFCFKDGAIWVSDNGSGIDPELLEYITDPSVKGKQSQGFGFGMAIVKRLCEHQDWGLEIANGVMDSAQGSATNGATIKVAF